MTEVERVTEERPTPGRADIPCTGAGTRAVLGRVAVDSPEEVRAKVERARRAQQAFAATGFRQRRQLLEALQRHIVDRADELCDWIVQDSGKTHQHALVGEIWPVCEKLRWTIRHGEKHLRPERVSSGMLVHKRARLEFRPLGVVGAILPWNYPLQNILNPTIPALMAGNAVVVKPSEWVAWSSARIVQSLRDVIQQAGFDPQLLQVVQGYGETGRALVTSGVDVVVFIGSVANGRRVIEASAETLVPVVMELGGKDPLIVCDDADLEQAAHAAVGGCFINCGQNCVASERILVHADVYDAFAARVGELARGLTQGPSTRDRATDVGAMITPLQLEVVERLVQRAVEQGARVVAGGERVLHEQGDYFAPTVLADVTEEMDIMREETFGPVMLLSRVDDDEQAIRVANGTSYGLSSSVFSRDHARARAIADRVQAGMAAINDFGGLTYMAQDLTFGGVKASGFGRMNGREGLRSLCNTKAVLDDRLPLHLPTKVFPVADRAYGDTRSVIQALYGQGPAQRLRGVLGLLKRR